jgi:hypothetical protein
LPGSASIADDEAFAVGRGDRDFHAELVALVRLALGEAFDLGRMQRVELGAIGLLLREETPDQRQRALETRREVGALRELARNVARDTAEEDLEALDLAPGATHLPRVRVAARQAQCALRQPPIALPQLQPVPGGKPNQDLAAAVVETRVERMCDRLGLHRRVDRHPLEARRLHRAGRQRRLDRGGEQPLHPGRADPLAPARQRARIDRQLVLQVVEAAEELPVRVLDPALAHPLVGEVVGVLQVSEPDHQPRRLAGTSRPLVVERPERALKALPVDQSGQSHQRMPEIELLAQSRPEKIVGLSVLSSFRAHRKSPGKAAAAPHFRQSTMFRSAQESLRRRRFSFFQGRLRSAEPLRLQLRDACFALFKLTGS